VKPRTASNEEMESLPALLTPLSYAPLRPPAGRRNQGFS
jgi:hypothetical protein